MLPEADQDAAVQGANSTALDAPSPGGAEVGTQGAEADSAATGPPPTEPAEVPKDHTDLFTHAVAISPVQGPFQSLDCVFVELRWATTEVIVKKRYATFTFTQLMAGIFATTTFTNLLRGLIAWCLAQLVACCRRTTAWARTRRRKKTVAGLALRSPVPRSPDGRRRAMSARGPAWARTTGDDRPRWGGTPVAPPYTKLE